MPRRKLRLKLKANPNRETSVSKDGSTTTSTPVSTPQRRRPRPSLSVPLQELESSLASNQFTYTGWKKDVEEFQILQAKYHDDPSINSTVADWVLTSRLQGMQHKQQAFLGDRSHPYLKQLDALLPHLQYPGWPQDYQAALQVHYGHDNEWHRQRALWRLQQKQCVLFNKDRSHPRLLELDQVASRLTYPGHERDANHCQDLHFQYADDYIGNSILEKQFQSLENRQTHWDGKKTNTVKELETLQLSYEGWKDDVQAVLEAHLHTTSTLTNGQVLEYATALQHVQHRDALAKGDRSHARLVALDAIAAAPLDSLGLQLFHQCEDTHLRYATDDWIGNAIFEQLLQALQYYLQKQKRSTPSTPAKKNHPKAQTSTSPSSTGTAITVSSSWSTGSYEEEDCHSDMEEEP